MPGPSGDDLCVGTTNGDTLGPVGHLVYGPTWTERSINLTPNIDLISGTQYAIVMRISGSGSGNWAYSYSRRPGLYSGGKAYESADSGGTWEIHISGVGNDESDMRFNTGGGDSYLPTPSGSPFDGLLLGCNGNQWKAQVFTASSDYTLSNITLLLAKQYQGSPGTITVSIRRTTPAKAINPVPTDANISVTLDQASVAWEDGGGADTYNVYYGDTSGNLSLVSSAQEGLFFTVTGITLGSPYGYLITRYWRIDSTNDSGTTEGDEWSFTTLRLRPPGPTYQYGGFYFQLLVNGDGDWGIPPPVGVEDTDYVVVTYLPNFISTTRRLVGVADSKVWYEDI